MKATPRIASQPCFLISPYGLGIRRRQGTILLKRVTLILDTGKVLKVFYPVFPPDQNAREVTEWLSQNEKAAEHKTS